MSFQDLPADWSRRPVVDEEIFLDLVDLLVTERDRQLGAVYVLLCGPTGRLMQPCVVEDLPPGGPGDDRRRALEVFADALRSSVADGGLVVIVARPGHTDTTDEDRAWHRAALSVCRSRRIRLLGAAVATPRRIWRLPDPLRLVRSA